MVKPCKPHQVRNPATNRCKNVSKKVTTVPIVPVPPTKKPTKPISQKSVSGIIDADVLLGLLEIEILTFIGLDNEKRTELFNKFWNSSAKEQLDDVCQGQISAGYVKNAIKKDDVSYILLLKVKGLIVSYALLTEKVSSVGVKYMYIDVICARKFSSTGRHMLEASENFSLRKGVSFVNLSSVSGAIGFYSKMGYRSMQVSDACGLPNSGELTDNFLLELVNEAKELISFSRDYEDRGKTVQDFDSNDIYRLFFRMGISQDQIVFLENKYKSNFKKWKNTMKNVDLTDYFDSKLLRMSKCLVDLGTAEVVPKTSPIPIHVMPPPVPSPPSVTVVGTNPEGMTVEVEDFDYEKYTVTIENPVYSRPSGENWIFYDSDANEFRRPTFGEDDDGFFGGNEAMDQDDVEEKIDDNVPVWVIDGDFGEFAR